MFNVGCTLGNRDRSKDEGNQCGQNKVSMNKEDESGPESQPTEGLSEVARWRSDKRASWSLKMMMKKMMTHICASMHSSGTRRLPQSCMSFALF